VFTALARRWRRSLAFRVVASTLVAATLLVSVSLGFLLVRVTNGLVDANTSKSIAEANVGLAAAQQVVLQASEAGPPVPSEGLADALMGALLTGSEGGSAFEVLLLDGSGPAVADLPERGTNLVQVSSVPAEMRAEVQLEGQEVWTFTTVRYVDAPEQPGLAVGALLPLGADVAYEVYYLFPYGELQGTLDLVRSTAWLAGTLLVALLGLIMLLIARHVVLPVRQAARAAELVRAGHLEQRLPVRGEDDLAALALAFNDMAASLQTQIRQLENLSRLQQRFVSDVSHELRTPLTTVRMASDVIYGQRDEIPPQLRRSSELLHDQLDRFEQLLTELLEISRFDAGGGAPGDGVGRCARTGRRCGCCDPAAGRVPRLPHRPGGSSGSVCGSGGSPSDRTCGAQPVVQRHRARAGGAHRSPGGGVRGRHRHLCARPRPRAR
jgi:two-component system sensor histidine kinase MtrB